MCPVRVSDREETPGFRGGEVTDVELLEMFRRMLRIRRFEETAMGLFSTGEIVGTLHTSIGQEAAIVGACLALRVDDYMVGTHRSHGHPIGKGARTDRLMAELYGRITGVNGGRGGSMHLADFSVGSLGETSIVGSGFPVAAGAALGAVMQDLDRVCLSFFGDGASNEGTFHESVNLSAVWRLPVIWFCENNLYGMMTPYADVANLPDVASRAAAYGIPGVVVDGQDVVEVYRTVTDAVRRARGGDGPTLIEAKTYRYMDHAVGLDFAGKYRPDEELAAWKERDPIQLFEEQAGRRPGRQPLALEEIRAEVEQEIAEAVAFARKSDSPHKAELFKYLYGPEGLTRSHGRADIG